MLSRFSNIQWLGVLLFYRVKTNWINVIPLSVSQSDPRYLSMPLDGESSHSKYIQLWEFRVIQSSEPLPQGSKSAFPSEGASTIEANIYFLLTEIVVLQITDRVFHKIINPSGKTRFCNLQYGPRNRGLWDIHLSLGSNRGGEFQFKGTFEFSRPCREIQQLSWPIITHLLTERCDNNS